MKDVRELIGVLGRDGNDLGLLVSASGYTKAALEEAAVSKIRVDLVSAPHIVEFLTTHCTGWTSDRSENGVIG